MRMPETAMTAAAAPIGWLMKILVALGKAAYWVVRLVLWILNRRKK